MDIYAALFEVQKAAPKVQKDAINPHFGSTYVTLNKLTEVMLPILTEHGILLIQAPENDGIRTTLFHPESGSEVTAWAAMPVSDNPQKMGSAITYYRRYALMSMLGLVADEDDDANAATAAVGSRRRREVVNEEPARTRF